MQYNGIEIKKVNYNGNTVKKIYLNNNLVFSAGAVVTYKVDSNTTYTEEIESDTSALSPKTFTPSKSGYSFLGWRKDSTASSSVLSSCVVTDPDPFTLYAVFRKQITVTYYNSLSTSASSTSQYEYYNNGNHAYPTFALTMGGVSGWSARGWSTSNSGSADITYNNGASFSRDSNITLYGLYQKSITLSYNGNGSTSGSVSSQSGTAYAAPGGYIWPSFSIKSNGFSRSNYTFMRWGLNGSGGTQYTAGATISLSSNATMYACWAVSQTSFGYTGGVQSYTVPVDGTYKLEVWGAGGEGFTNISYGSNGGYSSGQKYFSRGTVIYIVVGGGGGANSGGKGGYNGGGKGGECAGGGGATHMATASGVLSSLSSNRGAVLIVAGGGGGGCGWSDYKLVPGNGGGLSGGNGTRDNTPTGYGGTQTAGGSGYSAGSFGRGGDAPGVNGGGGGGGWYGGGAGGNYNGGMPGGGGSGYIGGVLSGSTTAGAGAFSGGNGSARIQAIG